MRYIAMATALGVILGVGGVYLALMYGPDSLVAF
jgi:hypothetical protein